MEVHPFFESLSVQSLGIEPYGFTDGTDNLDTVSIYETDSVSDSSCSSGDSSFKIETQPLSTTHDEGDGRVSGIFNGQKTFVDEVSQFTDSKNMNANAAPVDVATYTATKRKCYENLGLFHTDKPIWCSCYESQSNWDDYSYDKWKSLTNCHSSEDDHASEKHNCSSFYDEHDGPARPRGYMLEYSLQTLLSSPYGSSGLESYWARAPSPGNNLDQNSPVSSDYMYLLPLLPILEKNKYSKRLATLLQDTLRQRRKFGSLLPL